MKADASYQKRKKEKTMSNYVIFTDSCCDISPEVLGQWGVPYANMTFSFDGEDKEYISADISNKEFYDRMRAGAHARTAAINADAFACAFTFLARSCRIG